MGAERPGSPRGDLCVTGGRLPGRPSPQPSPTARGSKSRPAFEGEGSFARVSRGEGPPGGAATCKGPLPDKVVEGIRLFNRREFFEQHEALEEAWLAEPGPVRDLYRGILQIGVGFYHLERQNFRGARNLLTYGMDRLAPFEPACRGVDVRGLRAAALRCRDELERLGGERIADFDMDLIPLVRVDESVQVASGQGESQTSAASTDSNG